jgi:murein L,D-transpeptidase YcbB/YkuD
MTEIGLLMTGVLSTTQPSLPHLPAQQPFPIENGVQKSTNSQLSQVDFTSQITPPEFIEAETEKQSRILAIAIKRDNILKQIRQKQLLSTSFNIADTQNVTNKGQILARHQKYNTQTMPTLRFGSSGISVRILQRLLVSNGYGIRVDGIFGPLTEAAIKAFQNQHSLPVDGIVGQRTWWELSI